MVWFFVSTRQELHERVTGYNSRIQFINLPTSFDRNTAIFVRAKKLSSHA